jgi:hypothetical protein
MNYGRVHGQSVFCNPSYDDICRLLSDRKDILQYLTICSVNTSCVVNITCECKHLKSLFLYNDRWSPTNLDLKSLTELPNLECLQLCIPYETVIENTQVLGHEMHSLVKMEIIASGYIENSSINIMFHLCPNLEHVKLHTICLRDE